MTRAGIILAALVALSLPGCGPGTRDDEMAGGTVTARLVDARLAVAQRETEAARAWFCELMPVGELRRLEVSMPSFGTIVATMCARDR